MEAFPGWKVLTFLSLFGGVVIQPVGQAPHLPESVRTNVPPAVPGRYTRVLSTPVEEKGGPILQLGRLRPRHGEGCSMAAEWVGAGRTGPRIPPTPALSFPVCRTPQLPLSLLRSSSVRHSPGCFSLLPSLLSPPSLFPVSLLPLSRVCICLSLSSLCLRARIPSTAVTDPLSPLPVSCTAWSRS